MAVSISPSPSTLPLGCVGGLLVNLHFERPGKGMTHSLPGIIQARRGKCGSLVALVALEMSDDWLDPAFC